VKHKISAVPIVDASHKLIGNVSARDLTLLFKSKLDIKLKQPLTSTLADINGGVMRVSVSVSGNTTVRNVITKIVSGGVHRVYIVDEHDKLTGVISLGDILSYLLTIDKKNERTAVHNLEAILSSISFI
jgi:CBS-domain-containing membrane protein